MPNLGAGERWEVPRHSIPAAPVLLYKGLATLGAGATVTIAIFYTNGGEQWSFWG